MAQGGHVTPCIESNPLTACTRNRNRRNQATEECDKKEIYYSLLRYFMQLIYKVTMHKSVVDRELLISAVRELR